MKLIIDDKEYLVCTTWDSSINCFKSVVEVNENEYIGITKSKEGSIDALIQTLVICGKEVKIKD